MQETCHSIRRSPGPTLVGRQTPSIALTVYLTVYSWRSMTKRRGKGEGQVYQREDGRCIGEYDDANGRRSYVSGYTRLTRMVSFAKLPSALSVPPRSLASHPARQRFARVGRCQIVLLALACYRPAMPTFPPRVRRRSTLADTYAPLPLLGSLLTL
jgi:hypothetical protein